MKRLIIALLLFFVVPSMAHANCGNGNGNGNGCSGDTGNGGGNGGGNGNNGTPGPAGPAGANGTNGTNGTNGINGLDANVGTRAILGMGVRVASERYFDVDMFTDYDSTFGKVGFFGARIVFKPGKSYEERRIEKLEKAIRDAHLMMLPE